MKREKIAWMASVALIALLAVQLPWTMAQREDDYSFVRTLVDIHRQVAANYVETVDEDKLRQGAIDGMLAELDPYSIYVPPAKQEEFDRMLEGSFKGVGIQLNQKDNGQVEVVSPIDGSPAFKAGVQAGDIILKVNGESIEGLRLQQVISKITGKLGTEVTLTVRHATGEEADLTMQRDEIEVPSLKAYQRKPDNGWDWYVSENPKIAYVRITQFTGRTHDNLKSVLTDLLSDGMKGLILDLRFNPGGRLDQAVDVVDLLVDSGVIVSTKYRNRPEKVERATGVGTLPYFPIIVLVNEHSASAAEIVAGSLMDNKRALVLGTRTYGKGSVQEVVPLDGNNGELKLTVAYYYLPSGRLVHRKKDAKDWGVEPQIPVPVDATAEQKIFREQREAELFHKPLPKNTTRPTSLPATQMSDVQLQRAMDTMIALLVLGGRGEGGAPALVATTQPLSDQAAPQAESHDQHEDEGDDEAPVPATQPADVEPAAAPATVPATQTDEP